MQKGHGTSCSSRGSPVQDRSITAGGDLVCWRFSFVSDCSSRAGLWQSYSFLTHIQPQSHPASLHACIPGNERLLGNAYLQTNTVIPPVFGWRGKLRWGKKDLLTANLQRSCGSCADVGSALGTQLFPMLKHFLWCLKSGLLDFAIKKKKTY